MATTPQTVPPGHPGALPRAGVQTEIANQIEAGGSIKTAYDAAIAAALAAASVLTEQIERVQIEGAVEAGDSRELSVAVNSNETATLMGNSFTCLSADSGTVGYKFQLNDVDIDGMTSLDTLDGTWNDLTTTVDIADGDVLKIMIESATSDLGEAIAELKILKTMSLT